MHRAAPDRVTPEFTVQNDYIDGAVLLQFLHETYGKEKVHAVLVSDAGDFWLAMGQVLDRDREQLYGCWREWLAAQ